MQSYRSNMITTSDKSTIGGMVLNLLPAFIPLTSALPHLGSWGPLVENLLLSAGLCEMIPIQANKEKIIISSQFHNI